MEIGTGLWTLLRCPSCADPLTLERFGDDEGLLRSGCGAWYPVIRGIPRIFRGEMRALYAREFPEFLRAHALVGSAPHVFSAETRAKIATHDSFGYEWTHFHEMLPEWEENARFYFEPIGGAATLAGHLVFEGGCGKGRHSYHALANGARLVAVDFSRAIDVAQENCRDVAGERLFVQADLMNLPFAPDTFDLAYSLGVLHHLPDPRAGFGRIVSLVRSGGTVLIYVYHAREGEPVSRALLGLVNLARRITTRLPHRVLLPLSTALGYGLYVGVVVPYRLLSRVPGAEPLVEGLPLAGYRRYAARVIINDQFDRLSAPIENRYRRVEVEGWLASAGLVDHAILEGSGWRAAGRKPFGTGSQRDAS